MSPNRHPRALKIDACSSTSLVFAARQLTRSSALLGAGATCDAPGDTTESSRTGSAPRIAPPSPARPASTPSVTRTWSRRLGEPSRGSARGVYRPRSRTLNPARRSLASTRAGRFPRSSTGTTASASRTTLPRKSVSAASSGTASMVTSLATLRAAALTRSGCQVAASWADRHRRALPMHRDLSERAQSIGQSRPIGDRPGLHNGQVGLRLADLDLRLTALHNRRIDLRYRCSRIFGEPCSYCFGSRIVSHGPKVCLLVPDVNQ